MVKCKSITGLKLYVYITIDVFQYTYTVKPVIKDQPMESLSKHRGGLLIQVKFTTMVIENDGLFTQIVAQYRWSFKQVWLYVPYLMNIYHWLVQGLLINNPESIFKKYVFLYSLFIEIGYYYKLYIYHLYRGCLVWPHSSFLE